MELEIRGVKIRISYLFLALVGLFLITDSTGFAPYIVLACVVHELGHLAAMAFFSLVPRRISLQIFGVRIERAPFLPVSYRQEAVVYAAGPMVNFICGGLFWLWGTLQNKQELLQIAVLNFTIGGFNCLPVGVLDGGNALRMLLRQRFSVQLSRRVETAVSVVVLIPVAATAFWMAISHWRNYTLAITVGYLTVMLLVQSGD